MSLTTVPTNTSAPLCPYCLRPVTGPHHVDTTGAQWHLSCAEGRGLTCGQLGATCEHCDGCPEAETDGLDFWAEKE
jgi:hypothetical protein